MNIICPLEYRLLSLQEVSRNHTARISEHLQETFDSLNPHSVVVLNECLDILGWNRAVIEHCHLPMVDFIAYEQLRIANLVKNRQLAKSISDASWGRFILWLQYYGALHEIPVIGVEPAYTTQECSACGARVKKALSIRTHLCRSCGVVLDRDHNAAVNILAKASRTVGQTETASSADEDNASGQPPSTRSRRKRTMGKVAE